MGAVPGAGARLQRGESVALAELFREDEDWDQVRRQAEEGNILQVRTLSSAKRVARELVFRLQELSDRELDLLISGSREEQNHLLWVAVCRFLKRLASHSSPHRVRPTPHTSRKCGREVQGISSSTLNSGELVGFPYDVPKIPGCELPGLPRCCYAWRLKSGRAEPCSYSSKATCKCRIQLIPRQTLNQSRRGCGLLPPSGTGISFIRRRTSQWPSLVKSASWLNTSSG